VAGQVGEPVGIKNFRAICNNTSDILVMGFADTYGKRALTRRVRCA
jgi:hypothetical protein